MPKDAACTSSKKPCFHWGNSPFVGVIWMLLYFVDFPTKAGSVSYKSPDSPAVIRVCVGFAAPA
jgi:hypothetical protein